MYDFEKLLDDYGIDYKPKNSRGYTSIQCPMCGGSKHHGGFHENGFYVCWKCDCRNLYQIIKILTGKFWRDIELEYKTDLTARDLYLLEHGERQEKPKSVVLPMGTGPLNDRARRYLERRKFDPDNLAELYKLQSTGIHGQYNFRIIMPIYFKNQLVSYTGRDYTGQAELRYLSCKAEDEILNHKDLLYGFDQVPGDHVICVEGPADKWRMGLSAVATFGTGFKTNQINLLASFMKVTLLYDGEEEARRKCDHLGDQLAGMSCEVEAIYLKEGDPGELPQNEADDLVKDIMGE
jgi:hypothetical protein